MTRVKLKLLILLIILLFGACNKSYKSIKMKVNQFKEVELKTDLSNFSEKDKTIISLLIDISDIMDDIFWYEAYGEKEKLLNQTKNEYLKKYFLINYGPWERLNNNHPFINNVSEKPAGANFYPQDMTKEEFEKFSNDCKYSQYTLIRRDSNKNLICIPYHIAFKEKIEKAVKLLNKAAEITENENFRKYLKLRAKALLTDDYFESDIAWMDMKDSEIDFIVGPIETYEDKLFGYKAAHEAMILIKNPEWSDRFKKYINLLPVLQESLPIPDIFKNTKFSNESDIFIYDAIYYAGDCNAGSKTIAINLPNDEKVKAIKGSRKIQIKNVIEYKFQNILLPIANLVINKDQINYVNFDAFFNNVLFHEISHGLGISYVFDGTKTIREALKEYYNVIEEMKADIGGLYLISILKENNEIENDIMENYVTYMAGLIRTIRFGTASSHGKSNLVIFNFLNNKQAFTVNNNKIYLNENVFSESIRDLIKIIFSLQGSGNYNEAKKFIEENSNFPEELKRMIKVINNKNIPVDLVFKQGKNVLGLSQ